MIEIIFIIVFFAIALIGLYRHEKWYSPRLLFLLEFAIILTLSMFRLYGMYDASTMSKTCIIVGVVSFVIGTLLGDVISIKRYSPNKTEIKNYYEIRKYAYALLVLLMIVYYYLEVTTNIGLLLKGVSLEKIRSNYFIAEPTGNTLFGVIKEYLLAPIPVVLLAITFSRIIVDKVKKLDICLSLLIVVCEVITTGGRQILLDVIIYILVFVAYKGFSISSKVKRRILGLALLSFSCIIIIGNLRGTSDFTKQIYNYICGCVPLLGKYIDRIATTKVDTIIFASYHGVFSLPFFILKNLGIMGYPELYSSATNLMYTQTYLPISPTHDMCAFVTPFFDFYIDGGIIAIILGMFIFGLYTQRSYIRFQKSINHRNAAIFAIMLLALTRPYGHFLFSNAKYVVALVYILFVYKKNHLENLNGKVITR